jgi:hypothetical protein
LLSEPPAAGFVQVMFTGASKQPAAKPAQLRFDLLGPQQRPKNSSELWCSFAPLSNPQKIQVNNIDYY